VTTNIARRGKAKVIAERVGAMNDVTSGRAINITETLERLCYRYPSPLVDAVTEHEPGRRMVAVKNVTVNEEFFQGHFPGTPLMPGVLMIETLAQVATILLMHGTEGASGDRVFLRGVDNAKFRRSVVPGDRLRLEVTLGARRSKIARANAAAYIDDMLVAEAELVMGLVGGAESVPDRALVDPTAVVHPAARIGAGTRIGPHAVIGEHVRIGRNCRIGASTVVDGYTEIGEGNEIFPFASVGLIPQDLKFGGEPTKLVIGDRNVIREFVTIHRGTGGGGGITEIGDHNVFMAYAHVAHDCHVGSHTIFGNAATLGGHVTVEDYATISAFSGVHQFCRVGQHAFIGGFSVITKDALPYAKTVGNRARIYGLNTIGLVRRKFAPDSIAKLRRAYRILLHSNTSRALARIEKDPSLKCPEVQYVVDFIRSSKRGAGLRRPSRRVEDDAEE
jgi:UDP-N-acetylglucosamine acyltransferase